MEYDIEWDMSYNLSPGKVLAIAMAVWICHGLVEQDILQQEDMQYAEYIFKHLDEFLTVLDEDGSVKGSNTV